MKNNDKKELHESTVEKTILTEKCLLQLNHFLKISKFLKIASFVNIGITLIFAIVFGIFFGQVVNQYAPNGIIASADLNTAIQEFIGLLFSQYLWMSILAILFLTFHFSITIYWSIKCFKLKKFYLLKDQAIIWGVAALFFFTVFSAHNMAKEVETFMSENTKTNS